MSERDVIEVELPDGRKYEAAAPTAEQWERYCNKIMRGEDVVGRRELVQCCAVSCTPEEAVEIVRRFPGMVRPVSEALGNLAAGGAEAVAADGAVSVLGLTIAAPTIDEWEKLQRDTQRVGSSSLRHGLIAWSDNREEAALVFSRYPAAVQVALAELGRMVGTHVTITVKKG